MFFRTSKIFIFLFLIILLPLSLTGCKSNLFNKTFSDKDEEIKKELIELAKKEYNSDIKVKIINKTIGVYFPVKKLLEDDKAEEKKLNKETAEKIDRVIFLIHRVALSSNKDLDFYTVVVVDMESGEELSIAGYFYDVYRARLSDISKGEFSKRLLQGLNKNPKAINDWEGKNFEMKEIFLPDFLAIQIAQRIKIATLKKKDEPEKNNFFLLCLKTKN